jgi:F-type H+-transporting ATPase subunit a
VASPLKQFEIKSIAPIEVGGVDVSFTNSSLFMVIVITAITLFLVLGMRKRALVPGRWQSMAELSYEFIAGLVRDNVGHEGRAYFPFVFSLFMFILFANTIGLIPYSFTVTSHIIVTFALAALVFLGVTVVAIIKHRMKFFSYFLPAGTPLYMAPLLIPIEIMSYLARPVTLSLPMVVLIPLYLLELIVALLQAFVFTILTCLYLHDAIHLH